MHTVGARQSSGRCQRAYHGKEQLVDPKYVLHPPAIHEVPGCNEQALKMLTLIS